jgi:POT family proton-dependent oligopeptide transporter
MTNGPGNTEVAQKPQTRNPGLIAFLKSHPPGFWFIFWGEFAERASFYGMRAILATYMARKLGLGEANSGTFFAFFTAACYFLPLLGGYVADNFLGKYPTIVGFSVPYILGHVVLGIENTTCLFIALTLLAMGAGVIKPNISPLMGLTYDQQRPGQELLRSQAFSMFYMAINIGAAIAQFSMPVIRDEYGYFIAFLFPAGLMAVAFIIFALGKPFYAIEVIERKAKTKEDYAQMFQVVRRIAGVFLLVAFFWSIFDQSASTWIFFGQVYQQEFTLLGQRMTPERIQFFNPVLIVVLLPFVMYLWASLEKKGIKVKATSKMMAGFVITGLCMSVMSLSGFRAGPLETLYVPLNNAGATLAAKSRADKALPPAFDAASVFGAAAGRASWPAILASSAAPDLGKEVYVRPENKVTLWWQTLAYLALTIAEILISVTGLEMAFVVAPKSLKGFVTALWLLTVFLGNFFLNAPLGQLYPNMHPGVYFLMLTGMMVGVIIVFAFVAPRFNRLMNAVAAEEQRV